MKPYTKEEHYIKMCVKEYSYCSKTGKGDYPTLTFCAGGGYPFVSLLAVFLVSFCNFHNISRKKIYTVIKKIEFASVSDIKLIKSKKDFAHNVPANSTAKLLINLANFVKNLVQMTCLTSLKFAQICN